MTPLPDRTVIIGLIATVAVCFALVFWFVRLHPGPTSQPLQWRTVPADRPAQPLI